MLKIPMVRPGEVVVRGGAREAAAMEEGEENGKNYKGDVDVESDG